MPKQGVKAVVPRLRFPEFRKDAWSSVPGDELFDQINNREADADLPILAITQEHGAIPRDLIDYHVSVTDKSIESYKVVERGDFIISLRSFQGGIEFSTYRGICSSAYVILRRKGSGSDSYFKQLFKSNRFIQQMTRNIEGLRDGKMISYKQFSELLIPTPLIKEQQRIADCLTSLDEVIAAQGKKVKALKAHKRGLMQQLFPREGETRPRLRFPEFRDASEWKTDHVNKLISTVSPPRKIPTSGYGAEGLLPIVDQSSDPICGWTDDLDASVNDPLPLIIFGDHTCVLKFVERAFAQGADGIKIISSKPCIQIRFLYYALQLDPISSMAYRRHFSLLQEKRVAFPESFAEQQRIADCLSSLDTKITAESDQLAGLKTHKQGLMQQLFPAPEDA